MNPAPKFELSPEECLKLFKQIYVLADSGAECHRNLDDHIQIDLKMTTTIIDPFLYCQFEDDQLVEIKEKVMLMTFFEQERVNGKLTQMIHLNGF